MEDQTSTNTEALEATSNDAPSDEAATETTKRNGRTLKLKASEAEASSEASGDAAAETETVGDTGGEEAPQGRSRRGRQRRPRRDPHTPSENPMSLTDLKNKSTQELLPQTAAHKHRNTQIPAKYANNTHKT